MAELPMSEGQILKHDKPTARSSSSCGASLLRQFGHIVLLLIKFKAWYSIFLVLTVLAVLFTLLSALMSKHASDKKGGGGSGNGPVFYGAADLVKSGHKLLLDRTTFPTEAAALTSIMAERNAGGGTGWLQYCTPESKCRAELVSERDALVSANIRYAKSPGNRTILECFQVADSNLRCAFLYQLMAQSMQRSVPDGTFKDVELFSQSEFSTDNPYLQAIKQIKMENLTTPQRATWPNPACKDWRDNEEYKETSLKALLLITITVSFYFVITTVNFVRSIKTEGFFQHLVRSGFSVTSYWTAIWFITLLECILFSSVFVLSHVLPCPGVYPTDTAIHVVAVLAFYCLALAGTTLFAELLVPQVMAISLLMMALSAIICIVFTARAIIAQKCKFLLVILPHLDAHHYITTYMTTGVAAEEEKPQYKLNMVLNSGAAVLVMALIIAYLDFILRSGNGMCLPPYYPITCSFWCPATKSDTNDEGNMASDSEAEAHIEPAVGLSASIIVNKVSKAYRNCCSGGPTVLHELSCRIYKNQITALIGHNGAGKSTLIKILTGDECPDSGTAYISGFMVTDALKRLAMRGRLSVCPQFDCLCGSLTVMESILITLHGKGISSDVEVQKARSMLRSLGLGDKEDVLSTDLSGGQKRKVNTILALLGGPDVVFLDEPTSGLDPVSRRQLWQLLQEEKLGKSIVLCTQFMDEADILADRKIFLCGGKIVCAGSSMFLKRAFGCSSTLNVSLKSEADAPRLLARLQQVRLKNQFKTELQLEVAASNAAALSKAVQVLESSSEIEAFGLSQANLDDIFMRLSGVSSAEIIEAFQSGQLTKFIEKTDKDFVGKESVELGKPQGQSEKVQPSSLKQFSALLLTNLRRHVRTRSSLWSRFVVPAALLAVLALYLYVSAKLMEPSGASGDDGEDAMRLEQQREMAELDSVSLRSELRSSDNSFSYFTACVYDTDTDPAAFNESCATLRDLETENSKNVTMPFMILSKPPSESLGAFMRQETALEPIRKMCKLEKFGCTCIVYYASSWVQTEPNSGRTVTIGVYISGRRPDFVTVHSYRLAFNKLSRFFGIGELQNVTALSHLKPLSQFWTLKFELLVFLVVFSLFPVSYLSDPIEDISSRVRGHLTSMGMSHTAYWLNIFLQHWIQYAICFVISMMMLLSRDQYRHQYFILTACLPALLLGTASNQMTVYVVAALTRTSSTIVSLACNIFALALPAVFFNLSTSGSGIVMPLILLLPPVAPVALVFFCVMQAVYSQLYYHAESVSEIPDLLANCWNHKYILVALLAMPIHILAMGGLIAVSENGAVIRAALCSRGKARGSDEPASSMDQGAQKELERLQQSPRNPTNVLEVRQLSKTYPNGVRAVRGVTFGVLAGEIFGLLGANGAGKSTSMSVIVGEDTATGGVVEVRSRKDGEWASGRLGASMGFIGYCPQHNPLYDNVTVAEHLLLYAAIRGLPAAAAGPQVSVLIKGLGLQPHRDKFARQLSGGNKRRLCLAISLLGDPALIVVDEASTGVDPENKRFIWGAIRGILQEQRSVMVTTHSMEEVEALCSRVGIMNKGSLIAFGTVQQLRSRHGDAFTLDVLLKQEAEPALQKKKARLKGAISSQFKGALVVEDLAVCVQFCVPKKAVSSMSSALSWLDANQKQLEMHYHAFYQMSLDQVFVKLVKQYDSASQ